MIHFESLEKLGLSQKEQEVYFALLQMEKATANEISYKTKLKRPTTYDILARLKQGNFIFESQEGKKRNFVAISPEEISELLDERKRELEQDLPFLMSVYNTQVRRPKVAYFEGLEGIKQLYEDTLKILKSGDEILAYVTAETPEVLPGYSADYIRRRVEKGIKFRGIYEKSPTIIKYMKKNREQLREAKIVDPKIFPIKNEINIYANKIIINTYKPEPFGVMIESAEIAQTQRTIFEMAWKGIK